MGAAAAMSEPAQIVVGTAGHIDHGKSRLVWALTGTNPDRLPEEQARGMTIDLGFAHLRVGECDIWLVDVPGHERFLRNMVAGASGIDAAMLVVAADDSVMPQTREHAEVLALLGVTRVAVVLTKIDLVDADWADAVELETRELLAGVGIEPAACVRTSALSGAGLDELRGVLAKLAIESRRERAQPAWFRLPIDRAFVIAGRGTVVTGSVAHGSLHRDDELELWPRGRRVRVRDLQSHNTARDAAGGRMRLAANLAGVAHDEVGRGCELATPGYLAPVRTLDAWVVSLRLRGRGARRRLRLRLHTKTSDVLAELRLLGEPSGSTYRGFAQVHLAEPIVATWNQPFILRDESATYTLGGGRFVRTLAIRWSAAAPPDEARLVLLRDGGPSERLEEVLRGAAWNSPGEPRLAAAAGLGGAEQCADLLAKLRSAGRARAFDAAGTTIHLHADVLSRLARDLAERVDQYLRTNARAAGIPRAQWPGWMPRACPETLRVPLANFLIESRAFVDEGGFVKPPGRAAEMSPPDAALLEAALEEFFAGAFQPPEFAALRCRTARNELRLRELIQYAVARRQLVRFGDGLWLHAQRWNEALERLAAALRQQERMTMAEIRTLLGTSRKFAVPLAEALDAAGVTRRVGDYRQAGPALPAAEPPATGGGA